MTSRGRDTTMDRGVNDNEHDDGDVTDGKVEEENETMYRRRRRTTSCDIGLSSNE